MQQQLSKMSTEPSYEDLVPKIEQKETRESHTLLVHIPAGFLRQHIGAKVEFDYGRVRVFGELPLQNTIKRFNVVHQVPPTCDINRITGKVLEGGIISITMPKKVISDVEPEQKQHPAEEAKEEEEEEEKDEAPKTHVQEAEASPDKEPNGTPPQQETTALEGEDQKGKEGISEYQEPKSTEQDTGKAESTEIPEGVPQEAAFGAAKVQVEEKLTTPSGENEEKTRKEETNEDVEKSVEQGKQTEKPKLVDHTPTINIVKESIEKRKGKNNSSVPKVVEKDEKKVITEKKGMAAFASQTMTRFAKSFEEENKQKLIYMGAVVAVVALGVYASYKYRTPIRK